jgi:ATP-binding cassette subfamily B protein
MTSEEYNDPIQPKLDLKLWKKVFSYSFRYKKSLIILTIGVLLVALLEASFALVTRAVIDEVAIRGSDVRIGYYSIIYGLMALSIIGGVWLFILSAGNISNRVSHDIRGEGFRKLQSLEFSFYDHRPIGWLISRLTSDCDKLARIIAWGFIDMIWASCLVTSIAAILLVMHWKLGLIVLSVIPPLIVISVYFQKRLLHSSRKIRKFNSLITASYNESITGIRTTKTLGREEENFGEFRDLSSEMYSSSVTNALQSAIYMPLVLTMGSLAGGLVLWNGGEYVMHDALSLGTLIAFIFYTGQFFFPINEVANTLINMQAAQAAGERVVGLLNTEPAIKDSAEVLNRIKQFSKTAKTNDFACDGFPAKIKSVEFRNVDFAYEKSIPVLSDFSLSVQAGQTIALVGESGGGKSTIVNLVSRFYEPTSGSILINDVDYRRRSLSWLQSNLGIVLQTPHLFSGTIRENIRYGRLDATDAEVEEAARRVNADEFVRETEDGYETRVGEGGSRLSTGQKQLISFARALLADPQIFIMDEATSSIDTETEQIIQQGLEEIFRGRISFVIAHRLSTIRSADLILVIDKGRIRESGTHEELLRQNGHYFNLYTQQFRNERTAQILSDDQAI